MKSIIFTIIGTLVIIGAFMFGLSLPVSQNLGSLYQSGPTYSSATLATSSVGIYTSATVLSPKARGYAFIQNNTANHVYLCLAATCAVNTGILLQASSTYAITPDGQYTGAVSAIALNATSTLLTTELRQ
jgi:hypothetical protein